MDDSFGPRTKPCGGAVRHPTDRGSDRARCEWQRGSRREDPMRPRTPSVLARLATGSGTPGSSDSPGRTLAGLLAAPAVALPNPPREARSGSTCSFSRAVSAQRPLAVGQLAVFGTGLSLLTPYIVKPSDVLFRVGGTAADSRLALALVRVLPVPRQATPASARRWSRVIHFPGRRPRFSARRPNSPMPGLTGGRPLTRSRAARP